MLFYNIFLCLLLLASVPAHAGPRFCHLVIAEVVGGKPKPTLPSVADLSGTDQAKLADLEQAVRDSFSARPVTFWLAYKAILDRASFFHLRSSSLWATGYDEEGHHWLDDEDAHQFRIFSSRALADQCTVLSLAEAHIERVANPEMGEDLDEDIHPFLENTRRKLVLLGNHSARVTPITVTVAGKVPRTYPSVQWDIQPDMELLNYLLPQLGAFSLNELDTQTATMAVSPRFHAENVGVHHLNATVVQSTPDGKVMFLTPWRSFVKVTLGGCETADYAEPASISLKNFR